MSEALDEMLLNDVNDEDLDYDLDPKEEIALLQEDTDQDAEEDVLQLNEDYDQMEVIDSDKSDINARAKNDTKTIHSISEKNNVSQVQKNGRTEKFRKNQNQRRVFNKGARNTSVTRVRRSKTVLINPRFKGPVPVNNRQFAWESPPTMLNGPQNPQQYIQPWATGNVPNQNMSLPQYPVNQFNQTAFVPNNNNSYMYVPNNVQVQHSFVQPQAYANQIQPVLHQNVLPSPNFVNQPPTVQYNQCPTQYRFQPPPQIEPIHQIPETTKLPVHLRLGVPPNKFDQSPSFETYNPQSNNRIVVEDASYNQMAQSSFKVPNHTTQQHFAHNNRFHKKDTNKVLTNHSQNNEFKVVNSRRNFMQNQKRKSANEVRQEKQSNLKEVQPDCGEIPVIASDEDDETRKYRLKIEEQKRKREQFLRAKEESRLKSLKKKNPMAVQKSVNHQSRNFQQKKSFYNSRQQQNQYLPKVQNYTNNIVITGNDDFEFFKRTNKGFNASAADQPERIVTASATPSNNQFDAELNVSAGTEIDSGNLSSFLSNRSIIMQDDLVKTNIVIVKNLASTTTVPKIMKLCREIGKVQKIQMEKKGRQATVHFNTVASAHEFFKKFRRRMVDLSMIQVDLMPSEGTS